ncbi:MAG TPA: AAA family ATPase, partial [Actinomycetota bacterium]|nr:AAA family ATPase [Actinomycetota bacterium]
MGPATEATARHFELQRNAVVSRIIRRLTYGGFLPDAPGEGDPPLPDNANPFAFLVDERRSLEAQQPAGLDLHDHPCWWDEQLDAFERTQEEGLPLRSLGGDGVGARLMVGAGLIEDDIRYGSVFASLQAPLPARRPCVGLLSWLLADSVEDVAALRTRCHHLVGEGVLSVDNPSEPRSEWVVRVPLALWDLARLGEANATSLPASLAYRAPGSFPALRDVVVPGEMTEAISRLPGMLHAGSLSALVVRGMDGSGRLTLLGSLAQATGRGVAVHEGSVGDEGWRLLGPFAALANALPVIVARPAPGETLRLPRLPELTGPVGIVLGRSGGVDGPMVERAYGLTLTTCGPDERRVLWRSAGLHAAEPAVDEIAERFLLTPGNIHRTAALAGAVAAIQGRDLAEPGDVQTASRALNRQVLETLATPLPALDEAVRPVLTEAASGELGSVLARCRQRERLAGRVGPAFRGNLNRGVRVLLSGPSGSGKTLTARYVAASLSMDLYRIDLAAVVNKY